AGRAWAGVPARERGGGRGRAGVGGVLCGAGRGSRAVSGGSRVSTVARPAGTGAREPARGPPTGSDRERRGGTVGLASQQCPARLMGHTLVSGRGTRLSATGSGPEAG